MLSINFFALKRSGQHAIIFWLLNNLHCNLETYQIKGVKSFLDKTKKICYMNDDIIGRKTDETIKNYKVLIRNFEDKVFFSSANLNKTIIRDIVNTLCSRHAHSVLSGSLIDDFDRIVTLWKDYINRDYILYNRWLLDKKYRNKVSSDFLVENKDNISFVSSIGGGSSFMGTNLEKDRRNYNQRYKTIKLPKILVEKILADNDLIHANKEIFGLNVKSIYKIM